MNNETLSEINSITGNPQLSLKNSSGEAELITEACGVLNDLARADSYTEKCRDLVCYYDKVKQASASTESLHLPVHPPTLSECKGKKYSQFPGVRELFREVSKINFTLQKQELKILLTEA